MRRSAGCRHFSAVQRFGLTAAVCPPEAKILFGEVEEDEEEEISFICRTPLHGTCSKRGDGVLQKLISCESHRFVFLLPIFRC